MRLVFRFYSDYQYTVSSFCVHFVTELTETGLAHATHHRLSLLSLLVR